GTFTSFTYNLIVDVGGKATYFANSAAVGVNPNGDANQIQVAHGSADPNFNNKAEIDEDGVPSAKVHANIVADVPGFFVSPSVLTFIDFEAAFINISGSVTTYDGGNTIILGDTSTNPRRQPGGGNAALITVPEPLTLSLFGAGLAGAAAIRR